MALKLLELTRFLSPNLSIYFNFVRCWGFPVHSSFIEKSMRAVMRAVLCIVLFRVVMLAVLSAAALGVVNGAVLCVAVFRAIIRAVLGTVVLHAVIACCVMCTVLCTALRAIMRAMYRIACCRNIIPAARISDGKCIECGNVERRFKGTVIWRCREQF